MDVNKTSSASESSATGDANKKPSIAQEPFDNADSDADLILRTSDKVDFYVHKIFLRKASPIFADMFTVAHHEQSVPAVDAPNKPPPLPIVDVEETSSTIESILKVYYPVDEVKETSIHKVVEVTKTAFKYEMHKAITHMKKELLTYVSMDPISVYAHACSLNFEHEAFQAAEGCRRKWNPDWKKHCQLCGSSRSVSRYGVEDQYSFSSSIVGEMYQAIMHQNTAGHLYRLCQFVRSGVRTTFCSPSQQTTSEIEGGPPSPEKLCHSSIPKPDVIIRSMDHVDIPTHILVLTYASASKILDLPRESNSEELPVICLDEDGNTVRTLLHLCYPFAQYEVSSDTCTVSHIAHVRRTAEKYEMIEVARLARDVMEDHVEKYPMQVYFEASRHGWEREAKLAETQCLTLSDVEGPEAYTMEMEFASAETYYNLLKSWYQARSRPSYNLKWNPYDKAYCTAGSVAKSSNKKKKGKAGSSSYY